MELRSCGTECPFRRGFWTWRKPFHFCLWKISLSPDKVGADNRSGSETVVSNGLLYKRPSTVQQVETEINHVTEYIHNPLTP